MKKHAKHIVSILGLAAFSAFSAPVVEKVLVRQQWPWNEKVEIEYVLTGVEGTADVTCEVYDGETRLDVPKSAFGGMRFGLSDGTYKMNFNPSFAFPAGTAPKKLEFRLAAAEQDPASPSAEVIYKIFSLHDGTRTDITRGELMNGKWGSVETDFGAIGEGYKTDLENVCIWTGVTNYPHFKTTHIVMRKIDKGLLKLSKTTISETAEPNVNITSDFWLGVFEVTQAQFEYVYMRSDVAPWKGNTGKRQTYEYGNVWTNSLAPVHAINTYMLANGNETSLKYENVQWDSAKCFFGRIFQRTNLHFLIPTTAMWHKAARAGTRTWYYDGIEIEKPSSFDKVPNADVLGRYKGNGGVDEEGNPTGPVTVGSYRPNAYGLYDMFGNVREVIRDSADDAKWPTTLTDDFSSEQDGYNRGVLGGQYDSSGQYEYETNGQIHSSSDRTIGVGLRLWLSDAEASR